MRALEVYGAGIHPESLILLLFHAMNFTGENGHGAKDG